jgi:hypothetical protein
LRARYGGLGLNLETHFRAAIEISHHCGSADKLQSLVMAATQPPHAAGGEVILDGIWPYVTGIDHANWVDAERAQSCLG